MQSGSSGETDLARLLAGLSPDLSETAYAFATIPPDGKAPAGLNAIGWFAEEEGLTLIAPVDDLAGSSLVQSAPCAKISLKVHSSLAAVGLTAAIASALAQEGISANVVAGYFHDHIFVPWDKRQRALAILAGLAAKATNS